MGSIKLWQWFRPFRNKFQLIFFGALLLLISYFIVSNYILSIQNSEDKVLAQLSSAVKTASLSIASDEVKYLAEKYASKDGIIENDSDPVYLKLHRHLIGVQKSNGLQTPVYLIEFNQELNQFEFLVTSSLVPYWRHSYKRFPDRLIDNFNVGGVLELHESENGVWLSAFAPILNSEGETIALLMADKEFNTFLSEARSGLIANIGISLLGFMIISGFFYFFLKNDLRKEERYKKLLQKQNREIIDQNEELIVQKNNIDEQNQALSKANDTIQKKNDELRNINSHLDDLVELRTSALKNANDNVNTLLYRSSHDLLGPLSSMKGLVQLMKMSKPDENLVIYLEKMGIELGRLDKTVKSIDLIHRIQNGHHRLRPGNLDECVNQFLGQFPEYHDKIDIEIYQSRDKDILALIDPEIVFPILRELIDNGLNYSSKNMNGVSLFVNEDNSKTSLCIKSHGLPIDLEIQKRMFEMFFRGTNRSRGAGLGLYIVKLAVEKLNASIEYFYRDGSNIFEVQFMEIASNPDLEIDTIKSA